MYYVEMQSDWNCGNIFGIIKIFAVVLTAWLEAAKRTVPLSQSLCHKAIPSIGCLQRHPIFFVSAFV